MANQQRETSSGQQTFPNLPEVNLERVADYSVYDRTGEHIGKVNAIWTDHRGQPAFLGVKTSWLLGKTHIVPAYGARVNHQDEAIQLAYLEEDVKNAPNYNPDADLDYNKEREVFDYYRARGGRLPEVEPSRHPGWREQAGTTGPATRTGQEATIPLHEEQIRAGKREVEAGGVRLRKIVRTETVQRPVEVKHEDVVIERVPAGQRRPSREAFSNEEIFIPLRREEPVIEKETRVTGEVHARKTAGTERHTVTGEVRKEDVEVERERRKAA
jgi:uncharacterized protein (TIGR02271 family)